MQQQKEKEINQGTRLENYIFIEMVSKIIITIIIQPAVYMKGSAPKNIFTIITNM